MKFLATALVLWSANALASECSTVWVYQPYGTCVVGESHEVITTVTSSKVIHGGGHTEDEICKIAAAEQQQNLPSDQRAVVVAKSDSGTKDWKGDPIYTYNCGIEIQRSFPVTAADPKCPITDPTWKSQPGQLPKSQVPGAAICLSCDDVPKEQAYQCFEDNMKNIVRPVAIELRPEDKSAMVDNLTALAKLPNVLTIGQAGQVQKMIDELKSK